MAGEYVRIADGLGAGITVHVDDELLLGRAARGFEGLEADPEVSRRHARIVRTPDGLVVEDLESRNGTYVNGERVERRLLVVGDRIRLGSSCTLELLQATAPRRLYDDDVMRPWFDHAMRRVPGVELFDVHGHTGFNDPDGFKFSGEELKATLADVGARGVVIPMHEPDGYPPANDRVLAEAAASDGRLVAFCRLDPKRGPVYEATRCLGAGARGLKLHPRAEGFELSDPEVEPIFALAHERSLPVLIHAGRGIPTLARDAVAFAERYRDARVILAHAAISDLNWIWREAPKHPNLFFDTAWWHPNDLAALFALIPPGQLLYGSDLPYFTPIMSVTMVIRFGAQVGLSPETIEAILGRQSQRLLAGEEPLDLGPAPGPDSLRYSILLERLTAVLVLAVGRMLMGRTGYEPLALARLGCDVGDESCPEAQVARNVLAILRAQEQFVRENPGNGAPLAPGIRSIMLAACITRTPDVPLPAIPDLATDEEIRRVSAAGHRSFQATRLRPAVLSLPPDLRRSSAADHLFLDGDAD